MENHFHCCCNYSKTLIIQNSQKYYFKACLQCPSSLLVQYLKQIAKMNARQRGMSIKSDINKQGWQKSDFPVACEKCYGQNPYMRMLKQNYGQQCRLCFRPFTVFKWKGDRGIYKRTCICYSCSKEKNLCQVCTLDLEFGLPMDVRDKRCGVNGKYLMNQNFVSENNKKVKPPPPSTPPPIPKNIYEQKQAVFIPDQQEQSDDQQIKQEKAEQSHQPQQQSQEQQKVEHIQEKIADRIQENDKQKDEAHQQQEQKFEQPQQAQEINNVQELE